MVQMYQNIIQLPENEDQYEMLKGFCLIEPGLSVDGPPPNAIILPPDPGTHPRRLTATLKAAPMHPDTR
jgi:hypothetical protein